MIQSLMCDVSEIRSFRPNITQPFTKIDPPFVLLKNKMQRLNVVINSSNASILLVG